MTKLQTTNNKNKKIHWLIFHLTVTFEDTLNGVNENTRLPTPLESELFPWLNMVLHVPVEATVDEMTLSTSSPEIQLC